MPTVKQNLQAWNVNYEREKNLELWSPAREGRTE
jgi:hypothetical protein